MKIHKHYVYKSNLQYGITEPYPFKGAGNEEAIFSK